MVSQKCQYALRAIFELAQRGTDGHELVKIETVAKAQAIPVRFLENIFNQMRGGGFVSSARGRHGGYRLARDPAGLAVGEIIRFVDGPIGPLACAEQPLKPCPLRGQCVFESLWIRARDAMARVYDDTTVADLLAAERRRQERCRRPEINYTI